MHPVVLLTASIAIVGSNSLLLSPIAGSIANGFPSTTAADVMIASACYGLSTAVSALLLAPVADRIGLSRALGFSLIALTVALVISAASPSLFWLCAAQTLAGIGAGVALPTTYGLAVAIAPKGKESETLGWVLTGWTLSMVAGVSMSAVIADYIGWRVVFALLAAISSCLLIALHYFSALPNEKNITTKNSALDALKVPGISAALLVCAAYMIAFYGLYAYIGAHFKSVLNTSTSFAGLTTLAYGIGFGVATLLDKFIDKYGSQRASVWVFFLLCLVYCSLSLSASFAWAVVALCAVWGLANHLGLNLIVLRLTRLDINKRGAIMGLYSAVTYLCVFVGTSGFKPLFEGFGFGTCAFVAALCITPALVDAIRGLQHCKRSTLG